MVGCWFGLATKKSSTALNSVSTLQRNWVTLTTLQRYLPRPQLWTSPSRNKVSFYPFLILAKREKWIAFLFYKICTNPVQIKPLVIYSWKCLQYDYLPTCAALEDNRNRAVVSVWARTHKQFPLKLRWRIQLRHPDGTIAAHAHLSFAWVKKIRKCC